MPNNHRLPTRKLALALFSILILSACQAPKEYELLNGQSGELNDFKGQWLVLNYWAVWCKPCIKEIPELNQLDTHAHIQVLGINYDKPAKEKLAEQAKTLDVKFATLLEAPEQIIWHTHFGYAKPNALPTTVIFTPELKVADILIGPQDEKSLLAKIDELTAHQAASSADNIR